MLSDKTTFFNALQFSNAYELTYVTLLGNIMESNCWHPEKALCSIVFKPSGIVIDLRVLRRKALEPILEIVEDNVTFSILLFSKNKFDGIF